MCLFTLSGKELASQSAILQCAIWNNQRLRLIDNLFSLHNTMHQDSKYNDHSHKIKERSAEVQIADISWTWDCEFISANIITEKKVTSASKTEALWGSCII